MWWCGGAEGEKKGETEQERGGDLGEHLSLKAAGWTIAGGRWLKYRSRSHFPCACSIIHLSGSVLLSLSPVPRSRGILHNGPPLSDAPPPLLLLSGLKAFFTTPQLTPMDKASNALALGTSPIVRALIDPEGGMQDIRCVGVGGGEGEDKTCEP